MLSRREARKLTRGLKGEIQAHHILEARHAREWDLPVDELPAVILDKATHNRITAELRRELPYGGPPHSKEKVREVYRDVYGRLGFDEWLQHIEQYLR